ncbi:MAG: endolytic transglycosylase MltG [Ruminococcus sp.]
MDNKDFNRDKLLNDILRETAAQKDAAAPRQSAPTPPPRTSEPAQRPASEPAAPRQSQPTASQPAAQAFQPANAQPEPDSNTQTTLFDSAQWEMLSGGETASRSTIEDDPLYADLEGESEPFHPEPVHNNNNASTSAKRPRKKRKQHRIISALIMIIVIIGVSILLSSALIVYGRDLLGINSDSSTKIVTIPQGASMKEIAETLQQADIISKPDFFVFIAGMSDKDKDIKPGDHELRPDMAYETILSELVSKPLDSSLSVSVTFPEGIRLVDAADLLEENNVCDADEFLDHFNHDSKFGYA